MSSRPVIDVAALPESVLDHRSTIWWGNLLLIVIETMMFALLLGGYFYVRPNFESWPPPALALPFARENSRPPLALPSVNLFVLLVSVALIAIADRACLQRRARAVLLALVAFLLVTLASVVLRGLEFRALPFRWDDNAYASIVWTLLGLHLIHLLVGWLEIITMVTWIAVKGLDDKHARDVRVTAVYWYWVVGSWLVLYAVLFVGPRIP